MKHTVARTTTRRPAGHGILWIDVSDPMIEDVDGVMVPRPSPLMARDCFVVATSELSPVVRAFVTDWNRRRPSDGGKVTVGRVRRQRATFVGAYSWLAQESGVSEATIRDVHRGEARRRWTPLAEADAIVTALGRPDLLVDAPTPTLLASASIRVVPHPRGCC